MQTDKGAIFLLLCMPSKKKNEKKKEKEEYNNGNIACLLLEIGWIDPNHEAKQGDNTSVPILCMASDHKRIDIVTTLLDRGADINQASTNGITPLMIAKLCNHTEIVRLLERAQAQQSSRKKK